MARPSGPTAAGMASDRSSSPKKRRLDPPSSHVTSLKREQLSQTSPVHLDGSPLPGSSNALNRRNRPLRSPSRANNLGLSLGETREAPDPESDEADAPPKSSLRSQAQGAHRRDRESVAQPDSELVPKDTGSDSRRGVAPTSQRSIDGYLPGSIRRVALYRFVTYDHVEFRPGPNLNMIIGPNGTGKSTIASGIALGLGWSPNVLSRQKDLADFVKNDCDEGWIELELQGLPGQSNIVIRRTLVKTDNSSDWYLNGNKSSKAKVADRVAEFDIDISNLCSFLPQDKVASFARMSPQEVLIETEKTAGDPSLWKWHERLKEVDRILAKTETSLDSDVKERDNLKERNAALERDVRLFQERESMERNIYMLKVKILWLKYTAACREAEEYRNEKRRQKAHLKEVEKVGQPLVAKMARLEEEIKAMEGKLQSYRESMRQGDRRGNRLIKDIEEQGSTVDSLNDKMTHLKTAEEKRKQAIRDLRSEIAALEGKLEQGPPRVDLTGINERLRAVEHEDREAQSRLADVANDKIQVSTEGRSQLRSKDDLIKRLEALENVKDQRLENLRRGDRATFEAVQWLRQYQSMFQKPVFEPILLEINVTDPAFADAVEACINWPLMKTFICQTRADYDLFTREVIDQRKMRVTVAEVEGIQLESFRAPALPEEMQALGFERYILDVLDGPRDVLTHLCNTAHLHTIPVARSDRNVNIAKVEGSRLFKRFIIGNTNFTISYSSYGQKAAQTVSRAVMPARSLARSIDVKVKQQLEAQLQAIHDKIKELEGQNKLLQRREAELKKQQEDISSRRHGLKQEKKEKESARSEWERSKISLDLLRKRLADAEQRPSMETQRLGLIKKRRSHVEERAKLLRNLVNTAIEQLRQQDFVDTVSLTKKHQEDNGRLLARLHDEHRMATEEARELYRNAEAEAKRALSRSTEIYEQAAQLRDHAPPGCSDEEPGELDETLEDLQANLTREQAAYESAQGIRPGVKEQYHAREQEIAVLNEKIRKGESEKEALSSKVTTTKGKWQPRLEALVADVSKKFSAAFDSLGCAGEVRIKEAQNYEDWGIEILVKFRNEASLQVLTGQQQSGGERSLSTIMYLMSLTELSRSPFSLVDEINQGMDQRAERSVHNHMVSVTCQENASQYFLITPKLLTDLHYHPRMRVLIVNNGDWAPHESKLDKYVAKRKALAQGQGQSRVSPSRVASARS